MCIESYDGKNLGMCYICAFCKEQSHSFYHCLMGNDCFGKITDTKQCDSFRHLIDYTGDSL